MDGWMFGKWMNIKGNIIKCVNGAKSVANDC